MRKRYDLRELDKALTAHKEAAQEQAKAVAADIAAKLLDPAADDFNQGSGPRCELMHSAKQIRPDPDNGKGPDQVTVEQSRTPSSLMPPTKFTEQWM